MLVKNLHFSDLIKPLKETRNLFKKWPLNLSWISKKAITGVGNITKTATFKSFLHLSYKNKQLVFSWQCFLIFLIRKKLTDDFWWLHKNRNYTFPLINARLVFLKYMYIILIKNLRLHVKPNTHLLLKTKISHILWYND